MNSGVESTRTVNYVHNRVVDYFSEKEEAGFTGLQYGSLSSTNFQMEYHCGIYGSSGVGV
jgi:hypothetical protein